MIYPNFFAAQHDHWTRKNAKINVTIPKNPFFDDVCSPYSYDKVMLISKLLRYLMTKADLFYRKEEIFGKKLGEDKSIFFR